jgi:hypothetical protein
MIDKKYLIAAALLIAYKSMTGGFGDIKAQIDQGAENRKLRSDLTSQTVRAEIEQDEINRRAPIANERYRAGCSLVLKGDANGNIPKGEKQSTAIALGEPIYVSGTKKPLSVGNLACDGNGFTVAIVDSETGPVAGLPARTNDAAVIAEAVKKYAQRGVSIAPSAQ